WAPRVAARAREPVAGRTRASAPVRAGARARRPRDRRGAAHGWGAGGRRAGGPDACEHEQHLVVGAVEDVVLACGRGADLDRIDAEQRFYLFVWVLDDDPGLASVGGARAE